MLRTLLNSGENFREVLALVLLAVPIMLFSISFHELAHGYAAYKCGDGTAKAFGRLTLNPIKHLDPIGTLCLFLMGLGWAKPVPVNMRYFKKPKRDIVLVSIAGPAANFLLALLFGLLFAASCVVLYLKGVINENFYFINEAGYTTLMKVLVSFFSLGVSLNFTLGIFNLVPIPPLDGSKILMCALPGEMAARYARIQMYTRYIFLALVVSSWVAPVISNIIFLPVSWPADKLSTLLTDGLGRLAVRLFA